MTEARPVPSEPASSPLIEGPAGSASADDATPVGQIGAENPIGPDPEADERDDEFGAVDSEPMDIPAPHARQDKDHVGTDWDLTQPADHAPDQLP